MKFPSLFKSPETTTSAAAASSWPWTSCATNPKTPSFRGNAEADVMVDQTASSAYDLDDKVSLKSEISIRGLMRSERFFFEPGRTSSILEEAKPDHKKSAAAVEMDSEDPFRDFRVSMEEMVEAHALKDWEELEELLACYLRVNGESNHGYIIGAFVDLLFHLSGCGGDDDQNCSSSSTTTMTDQCSFTSPLSFCSCTYSSVSARLSNSQLENEDEIMEKNGGCSSSLFFV